MIIHVVVSDRYHPFTEITGRWSEIHPEHEVRVFNDLKWCDGGHLLVLAACHEIVPKDQRHKYDRCVVTHASDLPKGRGWSPAIWDILNGADKITMSVIKAEDRVDSGVVYAKFSVPIEKTDISRDIDAKMKQLFWKSLDFLTENFNMLDTFIEHQVGEPTYYPRREPKDHEIDPHKTIAEQWDLIRTAHYGRYPAIFSLHGKRYRFFVDTIG